MRFRLRQRFRLGPFYLVFSEHGFTSWGVHVWRFTKNFTRGVTTFDTPGPGYIQSRRRRR